MTVVLADVTGYTSFTELLDPDEGASLTHEALKELAEAVYQEAVYQNEGYIDKVMGDAIMAVFGAPVTDEDDPERALRAALAMRERLEAARTHLAWRRLCCQRGDDADPREHLEQAGAQLETSGCAQELEEMRRLLG